MGCGSFVGCKKSNWVVKPLHNIAKFSVSYYNNNIGNYLYYVYSIHFYLGKEERVTINEPFENWVAIHKSLGTTGIEFWGVVQTKQMTA